MTFHLHTQSFDNIPSLVAEVFPNFTLSKGTGYYNGQPEVSCLIEIETDKTESIEWLARNIAYVNAQASVLVEAYASNSHLTSAHPKRFTGPSSEWPFVERGAWDNSQERLL